MRPRDPTIRDPTTARPTATRRNARCRRGRRRSPRLPDPPVDRRRPRSLRARRPGRRWRTVAAAVDGAGPRHPAPGDPEPRSTPSDLRTDVRTTRATRLIVLCVDLSGSMGAPAGRPWRPAPCSASSTTPTSAATASPSSPSAATAPTSCWPRPRASTSPATASTTCHRRRHAVGRRAAPVAGARRPPRRPTTRCSSCSPTAGPPVHPTPSRTRWLSPRTVRRRGIDAVVVDCEDGPVRLGLAATLADALGAELLPLADGELTRALAAHQH